MKNKQHKMYSKLSFNCKLQMCPFKLMSFTPLTLKNERIQINERLMDLYFSNLNEKIQNKW